MAAKKYCACACGCGDIVTTKFRCVRGHSKFLIGVTCECGCGELANYGCRYIVGHSRRGKKNSKQHVQNVINAKEKNGSIRSVEERAKDQIVSFCACSCGGHTHPGNRYILGHQTVDKKLDAKTRKRMSLSHKGKIFSLETRLNISKSLMGDHGRKWKVLHPYMNTSGDLHRIKLCVLDRDRECVLCMTNKKLITHHIVPVKVGYKSPLCDHISNMVTICRRCHPKIEQTRPTSNEKWRESLSIFIEYLKQFEYEEILANSYIA